MQHIAVITGAAKNIGKGIAIRLLKDGMRCILVDNDELALKQTHSELQKIGACQEYVLDVSDSQSTEAFATWLDDQHLTVDTLVNNVGYESNKKVLELSPKEIQHSNAVNLEGPFYLSSLVSQRLAKAKKPGNIIFITSTHSRITRGHPLYSAAKAAIEMFIKESALELAPHNIRVNAVAPGPVEDTINPNPNKYVPLSVSQQPQDIAASVSFLISDEARLITGQTLTVDGGFSLVHTHHWIGQGKI